LNFLNVLSIKVKFVILFVLFALTVLLMGTIGFINISAMKKNLDSLYFGSLIPVVNLNKIVDSYSDGIEGTFHDVITNTISSKEAAIKIDKNLNKISKLWETYEKNYKTESEKPIIEALTKQIKNLKYYLDIANSKLSNGYKVEKSSVINIASSIEDVRFSIQNLIIYEVEVAEAERKMLLKTYDETIQQFYIIFALIVLAILFFTYLIFQSIEREQKNLQIAQMELETANEKLHESALTDELTTLNNRRYFNLTYEKEFRRALRAKIPFAFVMMDIDFFKQYNDTYGHLEGDQTLIKVAGVLKEIFKRSDDFIFRLGGEEFGVILTDGNRTQYEEIIAKVCEEIENLHIPHEKSSISDHVTISCGIAINEYRNSITHEELIKKADDALYDTKNSGRNGYKIYSDNGA
jgi:diguanylate cyclase (GGDEF)-like protein